MLLHRHYIAQSDNARQLPGLCKFRHSSHDLGIGGDVTTAIGAYTWNTSPIWVFLSGLTTTLVCVVRPQLQSGYDVDNLLYCWRIGFQECCCPKDQCGNMGTMRKRVRGRRRSRLLNGYSESPRIFHDLTETSLLQEDIPQTMR